MPSGRILKTTPIIRTARVLQLEGLFDVPPAERSEQTWDASLPIEERPWSIGLIVGPSGSGKSTVARELFGEHLCHGFDWPSDQSVVDAFPTGMSIKDITTVLSSVGFSSPPAWLRPYRVLSTGEQFRVTVARALAESADMVVLDEFTSVVDRTVAQIGSAAVAKTVRRSGKRLIAVTCHYDVEEWLQPDWVYQPHLARFQWRELQRRPAIDLVISRCGAEAWTMFRQHHYLSAGLNRCARCFLATWRSVPVAFTAVLPTMGFKNRWREHRTVCLPDFQGAGIGAAMSCAIGAIVAAATGGQYGSVTSHPAFIAARARSTDWRLATKAGLAMSSHGSRLRRGKPRMRAAASFRYSGKSWPDVGVARALWAESLSSSVNATTKTRVHAVRCG